MWQHKGRLVEWLLLRIESIAVFAALSWALIWAVALDRRTIRSAGSDLADRHRRRQRVLTAS
jgi:hypothetical protein